MKGRAESRTEFGAKDLLKKTVLKAFKRHKTMERAREFVVFASVLVLALLGFACSSSIGGYGTVKPPQEVLTRIEQTRSAMGCIANVLSTVGKFARIVYVLSTSSKLFFFGVQ